MKHKEVNFVELARSTDDFNGATQEGAGYFQLTARNGLRCSSAKAYLKPARAAMKEVCVARMTSFGQAGNGEKLRSSMSATA